MKCRARVDKDEGSELKSRESEVRLVLPASAIPTRASLAARGIDPAVFAPIFAVSIAKVTHQQASNSADTCADQRPLSATCDAANDRTGRSADTEVFLGRGAAAQNDDGGECNDNLFHVDTLTYET